MRRNSVPETPEKTEFDKGKQVREIAAGWKNVACERRTVRVEMRVFLSPRPEGLPCRAPLDTHLHNTPFASSVTAFI